MTDYAAYEVSDDKPPEEYNHNERRAELLQLMREAGHPDSLNQYRLADRYDVSQSTVSRDLKRLREYVADHLGDRRHTIADTVYRKAIKEYAERGDFQDAMDALERWNEWLRQEGVRETEPEAAEIHHDTTEAYKDFVGAASDGLDADNDDD